MGVMRRRMPLMVLLLLAMAGGRSCSVQPEEGCPDRCGDVLVPFPFGIGESCSLTPLFSLDCNNSFAPHKTMDGNVEVLDITLESAQMRLLSIVSSDCYNESGPETDRSIKWSQLLLKKRPYTYSYKENVFTGVGCDTVALINGTDGSNYTGGCISMCQSVDNVVDGYCSGMGCCQLSIPKGLRTYNSSLSSKNNHRGILDFNPCSYAFLVEKKSYSFHVSDLRGMTKTKRPVVLDWFVGSIKCKEAKKNTSSYACVSKNSYCYDADNGPGYLCGCSKGFHGNPYLIDERGCQDIDECKDPKTYPCLGVCVNTIGSYQCTCPEGTTGNVTTYGCNPIPRPPLVKTAIFVPVVIVAVLVAIALIVFIYAQIQKRNYIKSKNQNFIKNGGQDLMHRLAYDVNREDTEFTIFTREEIEEATANFHEDLVLGRGGQGVVYKGTMPNGDIFAIKRSLETDKSKVRDFINEVAILSQIRDDNVVKMVGCCLEFQEPVLVYEYVPNGTLSHHIMRSSLPWEIRLKVAAESARGLGSLHSLTPVRVIHRDVKSCNVLLDQNFTAKVADFGGSVLVPENKILVTALVLGTCGYLDPEYLQTQRLTDKSDVYSFGVILAELITGMKPFASVTDGEEERSLSKRFVASMTAGALDQIIDPVIWNENVMGQINKVARLALQCLSMKGEDRPKMMEVTMELDAMRGNTDDYQSWNCKPNGKTDNCYSDGMTTTSDGRVNFSGDRYVTIAMDNPGR